MKGDFFDYDELSAIPVEKIVITFHGSGDEGYVEEISTEPELPDGVEISGDFENHLQEAVYDILNSHHAGWEINEGSQGHVVVFLRERRALVHYGENEIKTTYYDTEVS